MCVHPFLAKSQEFVEVLKDFNAHLFKELQAVCVVIIGKVDNSSLAAVRVECLSQPSQS